MPMKTLISAADLARALAGPTPPRLLDCRFDLADTAAGRAAWAAGHLPGAIYAHLDDDLSGPKRGADGRFRGRHPLPDHEQLAATLGAWGIGPGTAVVAYDGQGGMYAARAWWLLRWLGHADVAVLDGGLGAWTGEGGAVDTAPPVVAPVAPYPSTTAALPTLDADSVRAGLGRLRLVDARAPERFRGEAEPLDRVAGHVPGAANRFFKDNLAPDGRFKAPEILRTEWAALAAGGALVHYCGSGVTACHNLLAAAHAGLGDGSLYPGSWSEWCDDTERPCARG